jgi:predicted glycogen debranching enzyme
VDSHFAPGQFTVPLDPGATVTITLSALPPDAAGAPTPAATTVAPPDSPSEIARLYRTADSFLVRRGQVAGAATEGSTIIAGYHWFGDWGRDTMIALPGCCLTTGRHAIAAEILRTFAATRRRGLLPNLFLEYGGEAYNTIDAALWFVHAVDRYVAATGDLDLAREVWPALMEIITYYRDGTDFGIRMDADGLILADAPGWQLTWMDAKIGDWVVTPRMGKAVEINALWYHDLRIMAEFAARLGLEDIFTPMADRAREAFDAFWYAEGGYLYDVLGATPDAAIRPNQVFAVSLPHSPLDDARARAVVEVVTRELLTPVGLRSLTPRDPAYRGHYGGDVWSRDGSYHQGTVWGWLIGPYVDAYLRVHGHSAEAKAAMRAHLGTLLAHVHDAGVGSVSEIFDGDAPHYPKGTVSQAWSVAEVLRAWEASQ